LTIERIGNDSVVCISCRNPGEQKYLALRCIVINI
jgi:hypothetical protein